MKSNKPFLFIIITILLLLFITPILSSCETDEDPPSKKYTITFDSKGGSTVQSISSPSINKITAPEDPTKDGYTFGWWYLNEDTSSEAYVFDKMPGKNFTLYAKWNIVDYNITYEFNGGTYSGNYPVTYNIESENINLITPTNENLTFLGWYENAKFTGEPVNSINKGSHGNKTLYAKWSVADYNITYEFNGGTFTGNYPVTYTIESEDLSLITPTKQNLHFAGWYDNALFTGEPITSIITGSQGNKTFYAKWNANVIFDTMGGSLIATSVVLDGNIFDIDNLPIPTKDGYAFSNWYFDKNLTELYEIGITPITKDTTLYAQYNKLNLPSTTTYFSDETFLLNQDPDVALTVISDKNLSGFSLYDDIMITSVTDQNEHMLHALSIGDNKYEVTSTDNFTPGCNYTIEINEPSCFEVTFSDGDNNDVAYVHKIYLSIKSENINEVDRKEEITFVQRENYYSLENQKLYLKQAYAIRTNIQENTILQIAQDDGSFIYGKVTSVGVATISGVKTVVVNLTQVDFCDIYDSVQIYENTEVDIDSFLNEIDLEALADEMANDENYLSFQYLSLCAVADYVNENNISKVYKVSMNHRNESPDILNMAYIDVKHSSFSLSKDKIGTIYIHASFRVVIDKDTYATITLDLSQYFTVNLYSSLDVFKINWNFDVGAYIGASTTLDSTFALNFKGKEYDIKKIMNSTIANPTPDGFVSDYKRNLNLDTDFVTLISKELIRPKYSICGILEVAIPIRINLSVDINAAFYTDIDFTISKQYGIEGKKGEGVSSYKRDGITKQTCDLYYSGYISLELGISASLELCFTDLDFIGKVGLSVEVGAYFDFYGYGKTYSSSSIIDGEEIEYSKVRGGTCWEVGVYFKMSLYAESEIFSASADTDIAKIKIPLLEGGEELIAYDFNNDIKEIEYINITKDGFDINQLDYRTLKFMNLKTGKTISKTGDEDLFMIMGAAYFTYDENTGKVMVKEQYDDIRHDSFVIIRYLYNVYSTEQFIELRIPLVYIPEDIEVPIGDLFTKHTVDFKINGVLYKSVEVYSGGRIRSPYIQKDWLDQYPEIDLAWFSQKKVFHTPIFEDCTFEASIRFKMAKVEFNYALIRNNNIGTFNSSAVGFISQDRLSDLESQLYDFSRTPLPNYTFVGWDYTGDGIADSDKLLEVHDRETTIKAVAIYEDTPFEVYLHIEAVTNNLGEILVPEQTVSDTLSIGETPNFKYETVPGYYLNIDNEILSGYHPCYCSQTFEGTLVRNKIFPVTVYDANNNILVQEYCAYTDNLSSIMSNSAVTNYTPVYTYSIPVGYEAEFIGWSNVEFLESVKFEINIRPIFDIKLITYLIKFDGGDGVIPAHNQHSAEIGVPVYKGEQLSEEFLAGFTPTKQSTTTCDYQFDDWYYNDEKGVKPATESITYVAKFIEVERKYKVVVLADYVYQQQDGSSFTSITINGTFNDGTNTKTIENLTYNEAMNLCNEIESGNYTNASGVTQPTTTNSAYVFNTWNTSIIHPDKTFEIAAQYKQYNFIRLGLDPGNGSFDGLTSNTILWTEFATNKPSEDFIISNILKPYDKFGSTFVYNEEIDHQQQKFGAYVDEHYLYTFKGWSLDGTTVLPEDYTLIVQQNEEIILTAIYDKTPIAKTARFIVNENDDTEGLYIYEDNTYKPRGSSYTIIRNYGTKINKNELPIARKTLVENTDNLMDKYLYEYTYEWKCVETNEIVKDNFDVDYTYEAVFSKVLRQIKITINAKAIDESTYEEIDANFTFSNGKSSITLTVDAGTVINELLLEIPTCDDETIKFENWNYYLPLIEYYDITITARFYKK